MRYEIQYINICFTTVEADSVEEAFSKLEDSDAYTVEVFQDPEVISVSSEDDD